MSWKRHFTTIETGGGSSSPLSYTGSQPGPARTNYSSFLPDVYTGAPNRVERYGQYNVMDQDSEVNAALDILAEFCTQQNTQNKTTFTLDFKQKATSKRYKKDGCEIAELSHFGYYNRFGAICSRKLELGEIGKDIAGLDTIICEKIYKFDIRFHFSPNVKVSTSIDKKSAIIITSEFGWNFIYEGDAQLYSEPSIFIDDRGLLVKTTQLLLTGSTNKKKNRDSVGTQKN